MAFVFGFLLEMGAFLGGDMYDRNQSIYTIATGTSLNT